MDPFVRPEDGAPSEGVNTRGATEAARRLGMYRELRAFTAWLLSESRSVASRLAGETQMAALTDLEPLEAELRRFEESCRLWERRRQELRRGLSSNGHAPRVPPPEATTPAPPRPSAAVAGARTAAALAWSRESRLIAARAQVRSREARAQADAIKARAREVSKLALALRTRTEGPPASPA